MEGWEAIGVRALSDEERGRAGLYGLLAHLLAAPPDVTVLNRLAGLRDDGTAIGGAFAALAAAAASATAESVADEYAALFIGLSGGELKPYASFYQSGFLYEKPLAELRRDLSRAGIGRAQGVSEPEDHIACLLETMHGLILGTFAAPASVKQQRMFFDRHLARWAPRLFSDLEDAASAVFYRPVGRLGRTLVAIEREAFDLVG